MIKDEENQLRIDSFNQGDIEALRDIWNGIVETGISFPEIEKLNAGAAEVFFNSQSHVGVARYNNEVAGLYVLHPNNVGRCGHIANASYAVYPAFRSKGIGRALVEDSLETAKKLDFRIMQFNAVLRTNTSALKLYESLGFTRLGVIKEGFLLDNGTYADIVPMYKNLT